MIGLVWMKSQNTCRREIAHKFFRLSTIFTFTFSKGASIDREPEPLGRKSGQNLWTIRALIGRLSDGGAGGRPHHLRRLGGGCLPGVQQLAVREIYPCELENQRNGFDSYSRSASSG